MRARKQDEDIPDTSGVYQIRCKRNGKIYVGSAVNLWTWNHDADRAFQ
ncbi:MAG: hypothetical protein E6K45_10960 [Gammaproteobacteria bacterium]|nr:MAG: hypothetical protein E6K45_10960 [Gammaproteobacteria bacterium]TLY88582.1 MAG: hypothetical protein E6K37_03960 [Gammaproteobacteria bacterium]TLZ02509.1 MAG: hypothetical protein E6K33_04665 [Gammaproteobacteria bacterium]TLZ10522.1 MAG: hypothetical protein E6K31_09925 [Gammaproteobacteria bacterium]TLZ18777.1 MAG: hypothetical protein E6K26_07830 [Gammaproteobacteria bacterium]